jgi:hypothetical protein
MPFVGALVREKSGGGPARQPGVRVAIPYPPLEVILRRLGGGTYLRDPCRERAAPVQVEGSDPLLGTIGHGSRPDQLGEQLSRRDSLDRNAAST